MNRNKLSAIRAILESCPSMPLTLLDVGASGGTHGRWHVIEDFLRTIGVEPDTNAHAELVRQAAPHDVFLDVALSKEAGAEVLYVANKPVCSSLYPPNMKLLNRFHESERFATKTTTTVPCSTLDAEFEKRELGQVDFIKLDVQGSEMNIVMGGQRVVASAFGIEIEVEFQPLYEGQPLFADVDMLLRKQGFELFDIARHFWRRPIGGDKGSYQGQLIWGDALYLRSIASFRALVKNAGSAEASAEKNGGGKYALLAKAISICLLYGYPDYARELVSEMKSDYPDDAIAFVSKQIDTYISGISWFPDFRGQTRLSIIFEYFVKVLSTNGFNADDPRLGN